MQFDGRTIDELVKLVELAQDARLREEAIRELDHLAHGKPCWQRRTWREDA